jgi:haloalkane dehalogenase
MPYEKETVDVLDRRMAYVDVGDGDPIVFLHGNPTSSYLWRNVIPHLEKLGRCVAPDLIGMGDSEKLKSSGPNVYTFQQHRKYLDELLDRLAIKKNVILVIHDWGSGLSFDWARRNRDKVAGIAYMEAIVQPVTWDDWPEDARKIFQAMRSPAGEEIVLEKNVFVGRILPGSILREAGLSRPESQQVDDWENDPQVMTLSKEQIPPMDADIMFYFFSDWGNREGPVMHEEWTRHPLWLPG